jgi:hypothetical protein
VSALLVSGLIILVSVTTSCLLLNQQEIASATGT